MNKKLVICYLLMMAALNVMAKRRYVKRIHKTPLHRSLEPDISFTAEELEIPKLATERKLLVINPRNFEEDEGRFFKHIFLLSGLLQPGRNPSGNMLPYLIINNPTNLTNINNNTLNNVAPPPAAAAAATGAGTGAAGARITYIRDSQALPYAIPMPLNTPVYQQRQQPDSQVVYGIPLNSFMETKRRPNWFGNGNGNNNNYPLQDTDRKYSNPFELFTYNLRNNAFL